MSALFDRTIDTLSKSMDLLLTRHSVTADNIANAETPGFKAQRVEFEGALASALGAEENGGGVSDIPSVKAQVLSDPENERGNDLNTVDMDREMAVMAKTETKYSASTQALIKKFGLLKIGISEGSDR